MVTGKGYVVCEDSAAPIWDNTERSGIHATHSDMCRFASPESPDFPIILAALLRYAREAHKMDRRKKIPRDTTVNRGLGVDRL